MSAAIRFLFKRLNFFENVPFDNQYGSKYPQAIFPPALPYCHCKRIFTLGIHLVTVIQSTRPATCLNHLNGMLLGFKKVTALAGDNFQNLIICEGTFIDRYPLIGGIISLRILSLFTLIFR